MMDTVDGDYQDYKANDGAFVRKHFFGQDPKLLEMVSRMTDDDIWRLNRGGHDPQKVYAAYAAAMQATGQPTVLLVKTVKGFGMGKSGEGKNTAHQTKKLDTATIREFRDRFNIPIPDEQLEDVPFYKPADDTPEMKYLHERRKALGGYLPQRRAPPTRSSLCRRSRPSRRCSSRPPKGREISTTQAFVRFLTQLLRDKDARPARRADPSGRGAHLRHGGPVPADRHLQPRRAAVRAGRPRPGHVLPRGQGRPDPAGRHQRGGRHELLDRRGDVVLDEQPHHGAVLRLLLDVRLPARRRPRLGRRRHAGARLPARRHLAAARR